MITTGEGGMATTNSRFIYEKIEMYKNHGITRDQKNLKLKKLGFWYYEQQYLGFNYRMNDISAALGLSQLKKLKIFLKKRNYLANNYHKLLSDLPVKRQKILLKKINQVITYTSFY